ncbi:MAG TPA: glucosaminidase domain-containing protein [Stenomitos sp.]
MDTKSTYLIQRGDTLDQIAKRYNTSIRTLMRLNRIENPHEIIAGETIKLPGDRLELSAAARQDSLIRSTDKPRRAAAADVNDLATVIKDKQRHPRSTFLKNMMPAAERIEAKYGLPAEVIVAQAALESNWGKSAIGTYNVFGIKGHGSLGSLAVTTHEHVHGRWHKVHANFAHYASYDEAFEAYARTLHNGSYDRALANKSDPIRFAKALQGVYATDPGYAAKIIRIMRQENLTL